jgi:hypothetical protein
MEPPEREDHVDITALLAPHAVVMAAINAQVEGFGRLAARRRCWHLPLLRASGGPRSLGRAGHGAVARGRGCHRPGRRGRRAPGLRPRDGDVAYPSVR